MAAGHRKSYIGFFQSIQQNCGHIELPFPLGNMLLILKILLLYKSRTPCPCHPHCHLSPGLLLVSDGKGFCSLHPPTVHTISPAAGSDVVTPQAETVPVFTLLSVHPQPPINCGCKRWSDHLAASWRHTFFSSHVLPRVWESLL